MGHLPPGISPLVVTGSLCWGLVVAGTLWAATDQHARTSIRRYALYLLLAIIVTLAWRFPERKGFFLGLEYEDSYVYTVVARQILQGNHVAESTRVTWRRFVTWEVSMIVNRPQRTRVTTSAVPTS